MTSKAIENSIFINNNTKHAFQKTINSQKSKSLSFPLGNITHTSKRNNQKILPHFLAATTIFKKPWRTKTKKITTQSMPLLKTTSTQKTTTVQFT